MSEPRRAPHTDRPIARSATSWWRERRPVVALPALHGAVRCDAVVIGGGVAGLHAAWRLSRGGADVVLLERDVCGDTTPDLGRFFGWSRPSVEPTALQRIVGKPLGFAIGILGARAGA